MGRGTSGERYFFWGAGQRMAPKKTGPPLWEKCGRCVNASGVRVILYAIKKNASSLRASLCDQASASHCRVVSTCSRDAPSAFGVPVTRWLKR